MFNKSKWVFECPLDSIILERNNLSNYGKVWFVWLTSGICCAVLIPLGTYGSVSILSNMYVQRNVWEIQKMNTIQLRNLLNCISINKFNLVEWSRTWWIDIRNVTLPCFLENFHCPKLLLCQKCCRHNLNSKQWTSSGEYPYLMTSDRGD
jgi:hypothetical protein